MKQLLIGMDTLCRVFGCGKTSGFKLVRERQVDSLLLGGKRMVTVASVEALVARLLTEAQQGDDQRGGELTHSSPIEEGQLSVRPAGRRNTKKAPIRSLGGQPHAPDGAEPSAEGLTQDGSSSAESPE